MAEPGPPVVSTGNFTATSGTRALPTGTAEGDLLIIVASSDTASTVPTYTATDFGSGTINDLVPYDTSSYSGATTTYQAWWKIAGGSEPANYTLGVSVSRLTGFTVVRIPAGTFDPSTPFNQVSAASNDTGLASEPTLPSVTTTTDENLVMRFIAWDESKTFASVTPAHTNLYHQDLSGHDQRGDYKSQATAGATGTAVYDLSSGTRWVGVTVAIQPPQTVTGTGASTLSITGSGSGTASAPSASDFSLDPADTNSVVTLSNGNLTATKTGGGTSFQTVRSLSGAYRSSGKFYFEAVPVGPAGTAVHMVGLAPAGMSVASGVSLQSLGAGAVGWQSSNGIVATDANGLATTGAWRLDSTPVGVAVDLDAHLLWVIRSGESWNGDAGADPAAGTGGLDISSLASSLCPAVAVRSASVSDAITINYGASAFNGTVPSGFSAWDTDPVITGTGAATLAITGAGSGAHGVAGTASATLGITGSGSGTFTNPPVTGSGAATLAITAAGTGAHGVAGQGSATLAITGSAAGAHGVAGQGDATLDLIGSGSGSVAVATVTGTGSADLIIVGEGVGRYLGWMAEDRTAETWTGATQTADTWAVVSATPETWATQSQTAETWTEADPTPEAWT